MAAVNPDFFHPGSPVRSPGHGYLNNSPININRILDTVSEEVDQEEFMTPLFNLQQNSAVVELALIISTGTLFD